MGGTASVPEDDHSEEGPSTAQDALKTLTTQIDTLAARYILSQSFSDRRRLASPEYCDAMVITTAPALHAKYGEGEIKALGGEAGEADEDMIMVPKSKLGELGREGSSEHRARCIAIASRYVKIAHVVAAILSALRPTYSWSLGGRTGEVAVPSSAPKGALVRRGRTTFCESRIKALAPSASDGQPLLEDPARPGIVQIDPIRVCGLNIDRRTGEVKTLAGEPGMPELEKLYYDKFNPVTGKYDSISQPGRDVYQADVDELYRSCTGNDPPRGQHGLPLVTSFKDIPLRDFYGGPRCFETKRRAKTAAACKVLDEAGACNAEVSCLWGPGKDGVAACSPSPLLGSFRREYEGSIRERVFREYGEHMAAMMARASEAQLRLAEVIDLLFAYKEVDGKMTEEITLNPEVRSPAKLDEAIRKARELLLRLYIGCEADFTVGLEKLEVIIQHTRAETIARSLSTLEADREALLSDTPEGRAITAQRGLESAQEEGADIMAALDAAHAARLDSTAVGEAERLPEGKRVEAGEAPRPQVSRVPTATSLAIEQARRLRADREAGRMQNPKGDEPQEE